MNKNHGGLVMEACGGAQCLNAFKRVMIPREHVWFPPEKSRRINIILTRPVEKLYYLQKEIMQEGCSTDGQVTASTLCLSLSLAKHKP